MANFPQLNVIRKSWVRTDHKFYDGGNVIPETQEAGRQFDDRADFSPKPPGDETDLEEVQGKPS